MNKIIIIILILIFISIFIIFFQSFNKKPRNDYIIGPGYYKCQKCNSIEGGIFGKGPFKNLRSKKAKWCIHKWEKITKKSIYKISSKVLFEIVTNNNDYSYRSDLKKIEIIETNGDIQTWKEINKDRQEIVFRTLKIIPYSYYEFEIIKANGFSGYWTGEFKSINENETEFIATEHIIIPNPIIRLLSYIFIDIGQIMETYQGDLENKVNDFVNAQNST